MIIHSALVQAAVRAESFDPFDFVKGGPGFGPFKDVLGPKLGVVLGLAWALGFAVCAFFLIEGLTKMGRARKVHSADAYDDAKSALGWPAGSIVMLSVLPLLFAQLAK